jgi:predicted nucleic acid-binding protein
MNKIFFDANILLDLLITNRTNHTRALEVLPHIIERFERLATSEDILTTIEYIATRHRIPCEKTAAFFEMLYTQFEILSFAPILAEALPTYTRMCRSGEAVDFEDFMQLRCAVAAGCDAFLTEDMGIVAEQDIQIIRLKDVQ